MHLIVDQVRMTPRPRRREWRTFVAGPWGRPSWPRIQRLTPPGMSLVDPRHPQNLAARPMRPKRFCGGTNFRISLSPPEPADVQAA